MKSLPYFLFLLKERKSLFVCLFVSLQTNELSLEIPFQTWNLGVFPGSVIQVLFGKIIHMSKRLTEQL